MGRALQFASIAGNPECIFDRKQKRLPRGFRGNGTGQLLVSDKWENSLAGISHRRRGNREFEIWGGI